MIPLKVQVLVLAVTATSAFSAGFVIQGWRLNSKHSEEMAKCTEAKHDLEIKITEQNGNIKLINYQSDIAKERQDQAERRAAAAERTAANRITQANQIKATSCIKMVEQLREID